MFAGLASLYPEPKDMEAFIRSTQYDYYYDSPLPATYPWPKDVEDHVPIGDLSDKELMY